MNKPKRLLVIFPESLSTIIGKGEIIDRYFNPGDTFDEVALLLTVADSVSLAAAQPLFGKAIFSVHSLPHPRFLTSLGWRRIFLKTWLDQGVEWARQFKPDLIRCYGNTENGFLGAQIKKQLGIPLVVSLHGDLDEDVRKKNPWWPDWKNRLISERQKLFERETLETADWVLPVYEPIVDYAKRYGAKNLRVFYNMTNQKSLRVKTNYRLGNPPQLVCVSRQFEKEKNPENIIRAVAPLKAKLTLIGRGPYHQSLKRIAADQRGPGEFEFLTSLSNDAVCERLPDFDIFVVQSENYEISKSVMEAMLTGLPVLLNKRRGTQVPELQGDWVRLVPDTPDSYARGLQELLSSGEQREALGRRAREHSRDHYSPEKTEAAYADFYRSLLS